VQCHTVQIGAVDIFSFSMIDVPLEYYIMTLYQLWLWLSSCSPEIRSIQLPLWVWLLSEF